MRFINKQQQQKTSPNPPHLHSIPNPLHNIPNPLLPVPPLANIQLVVNNRTVALVDAGEVYLRYELNERWGVGVLVPAYYLQLVKNARVGSALRTDNRGVPVR